MACYVPPHTVLIQGHRAAVTPAIVGATVSGADTELSKFGIHIVSEEAAAARRAEEERRRKIFTVIAGCVAGASMATALVAMYMEASAPAYLAFMFPFITAPLAISQRRKLNKLPVSWSTSNNDAYSPVRHDTTQCNPRAAAALREEHNKIRLQVNRLSQENDVLHQSIHKLDTQCKRLQVAEASFRALCRAQGQSTGNLQQLVTQNGHFVREMKAIQETQVLQQIMTAIIRSDTDGDWRINDKEMNLLLVRLKGLDGVKNIDEGRLRNAFRSTATKSMAALYHVTAGLMQEDELVLGRRNW